MFGLNKVEPEAIGVELSPDGIRMAQLTKTNVKNQIRLVASGSCPCPDTVPSGSVQWQRWTIESIKTLLSQHRFIGRIAIGGILASDLFIETMRVPKTNGNKLKDALYARIKTQLPFKGQRDELMMQTVCPDQDHAMIMVTQREQMNRYLASFEKAGLRVQSLVTWPEAMVNCYTHFFGRRKSDQASVVMLIDFRPTSTDVVVCRYRDVLMARSLPFDRKQLQDEKTRERLVLEILACRRQVLSMYRQAAIERLVFLSGTAMDEAVYTLVAKQLAVQTQIGDCCMAVDSDGATQPNGDANAVRVSWAAAFGLSLS